MSASENPNTLRPLRRFVTTNNTKGEGVFSSAVQEEAPVRPVLDGAMEFSLMYTTAQFPVSTEGEQDIQAYKRNVETKIPIVLPGGTVCRTVDFPPGYTSPMHRTISCDFGTVLEGEVELILDSGETRLLKRGDVAVQRLTNHAWRNTSKDSWARMFYVLQQAEPLQVGGKDIVEDEGGID